MHDREGAVVSVIGWRRSDDGYRIGPLYAQCASHEIALMAEALNALPAGAQVAIDIPEQATHIMAFVHSLGWVTRYCTDRMYRGMPPHPERNDVAGLFSVEAG